MKVSAISRTIIAPLVLMSAASCTDIGTGKKAKENVIPNLSATELLEAENCIEKHPSASFIENDIEVAYWDSILTANKANQAYLLGGQMVRDSIAGKPFTKPEYKLKLDTIINNNGYKIIEETSTECAKYYNAEDFIKLRNNVPENRVNKEFFTIESAPPNIVHYWNLINRTIAERKAFSDGANAERAKLNQ